MPTLITTEKIPSWAIYYLEYGDPTGLTEEDIAMVDDFIDDNFPNGYVMSFTNGLEATTYFTSHPAFGLACDVYDVDFYEP